MTVPTETARSGPYLGNGVTNTFTYEFRILAETHLRVTTVDGAGVESVLTLTTDYSVTGVGNASGGSAILTAPLANGLSLVITRNVPATQETDLENQGAFLAETIETALDKATMLIQQEGERSDRTVTLPVTSEGVSTSLPGVVANALLGWSADGSQLENKTPNDGTVLPTLLGSLTTDEITQLLNIGVTTISAAQWGYLGALAAPPLAPNQPATVTDLTATQRFIASGVLSPATLTADQNDYNPRGLADASYLRLSADTVRTITGLAGGTEGRMMIICNVSGGPVILASQSPSSQLANRFRFPQGNRRLIEGRSVLLRYDSGSGAWRGIDGPEPPDLSGLAPIPAGSAGVGQWQNVETAIGAAWTLPVGGTWAFTGLRITSGNLVIFGAASVQAGGTTAMSATGGALHRGLEWRIA